ncbi:MAG: hypothetical protein HZC40_08315 [Chloroflexi bacterium]|nr:hypothetical protein [Chloroflexota bacterium]
MFSQFTRWAKHSIVGAMALTVALFVLTTASFAQTEIKPVNSGFDPATHAFSFEMDGRNQSSDERRTLRRNGSIERADVHRQNQTG